MPNLCSQNSCEISSQLPKWWISYNPGKNFWNKIEKSSETGQDKKSLISTFACFLTATAKICMFFDCYLWLTGSVLKHCKVPKYYDQDCLKIFFLLSTLPAMIRISGKKMLIWFKKSSFCQKTTNKWWWNLSRVNFGSKLNMQNTAYTKSLNLGF